MRIIHKSVGVVVMKKYCRKAPKKLLIAAICLTVIFLTSVTAYAWFTNQRKLDTITRVNSPISLVVGAGAKEDSANIDMGGINVADTSGKKDFVFCVYSDDNVETYKIQLAHTTNIGFEYSIYEAAESMSDPGGERVVYIDESGNSHYYTKEAAAVSGQYLNKNGAAADNSLHDISYGNYNKVQKNAEPLYWQTDNAIQPVNNSGSGFLDYYILEVSWDANISNNKETDIVYITAGVV